MALSLPKEHPSGVVATYHRILRAHVDFAPTNANPGVTGPLVTVEIGEYLDADARAAGRPPVRTEVRTFVLQLDEGVEENLRALVYAQLSAPPKMREEVSPHPITGEPMKTLVQLTPSLGYEGATYI